MKHMSQNNGTIAQKRRTRDIVATIVRYGHGNSGNHKHNTQ